jgi:hypothetical protein
MLFHQHWEPKGHTFGTCMSTPDSNLMYVNIPKCASSWTKPNLQDLGWEFYNYHLDNMYHKHAMIVLRDPVERWLSGLCEYFTLYHENIDTTEFNSAFYDLLMDQITLDDHTEKQVYFVDGLDPSHCTFIMCDEDYRRNFTFWLHNQGFDQADYSRYNYQHTTQGSPIRKKFKELFLPLLDNPKYLEKVKHHFHLDYRLIWSVRFYGSQQLTKIHTG